MDLLARFISCFIPVRSVRRRVRKKLHMYTAAARKEAAQKEQLRQKYEELKQTWRIRNNGVSPVPGRFSEYDLAIPIGVNCPNVDLLIAHKLRRFSTPFDWSGGIEPENWYIRPDIWRDSRFREKMNSLCNGFKDWFNPADLKPTTMFISKQKHHYVVNTKTNVRFLHLFDIEKSIEMQMPEIVEKMERRSKRLLDAIDKSQRILVSWANALDDTRCFLDAPVSDQDILWVAEKLQERYPDKQFDLVFFEHDGTKNDYEFDKIEVAPGAYRIRSNHFVMQRAYKYVADYGWRAYLYVSAISEMLDNIALSDKLAGFMTEEK